jgi:hypothetical protein
MLTADARNTHGQARTGNRVRRAVFVLRSAGLHHQTAGRPPRRPFLVGRRARFRGLVDGQERAGGAPPPAPATPPHLHATRAEGTCCFLGLSPTPTLHRAIRLAKASDHRVSAAVPGGQEPKNNQVARVSPYRLAAHLTSAFVIYTGLLWTSLSVLYPMAPPLPSAVAAMRRARALLLPVGCPPSLSPSLRLPLSLGCVSVAR